MLKKFYLVLVVLSLLLAACSGGSNPTPEAKVTSVSTDMPATVAPTDVPATIAPTDVPATTAPTDVPSIEVAASCIVDPLDVTGDIVAAGSSTVFPLAEQMAELFTKEGFAGNVTIDSIGSGAGFERFCVAGETDIALSSRAIKDEEVASCNTINREPIEFRIGTDGLAIVVSKENDFVTNLTKDELVALFSTAKNWSDVNPSLPNEPILRYIPGTDSGTFDYFVEELFDKDKAPILEASNLEMSEDDNVLVEGTLGSKYAVSFFGYAYYEENADKLNVLSIDGVKPTAETVDAGEYILSRPLFFYSTAAIIQEKPQVSAFINYVIANVNDEITKVGYFPTNLSKAKTSWSEATGCMMEMEAGDDDMDMESEESSNVALPEVDPLSLTDDIVAAGSSTVYPLVEKIAELFNTEGFAGNITIDSIGSGGGFERFCVAGETDIATASRAIKDEEIASCKEINREPIELRVGTDALAVVVSKENDFATNITMEELAALFSTAKNWSDINPEWPNEPILRYIPGTDSGTFDYFIEAVFEKDSAPVLAANPEMSEDDNVLVQGTLGSPYAVSFFGYAYYEENADDLKVLSVNDITPNSETVSNGEYSLSRPLYLYTTAEIMQEKPQVAGFINYFLSNVNDQIVEVGYFPATSADLDVAKQSWIDANP